MYILIIVPLDIHKSGEDNRAQGFHKYCSILRKTINVDRMDVSTNTHFGHKYWNVLP